MQCKTGSYVGTGIPHGITWATEPLFTPDVVIIKADDSQAAVFRTSAMPAFQTAAFALAASLFSNAITAFIVNGFQINTHSTVNANGVNYYWAAFYDNGAGDMDVGSYTGNGLDDRNLDIVGFQPSILWIKGDQSYAGSWRTGEIAGDRTIYFGCVPVSSNGIQSFRPLGFQVGSSPRVNSDGIKHYYVAFRDVAGFVEIGVYIGNGIDDRNINVGFEPDLVFVKEEYYGCGVLRIDTMPLGQSGRFNPVALTPDRVQAFAANVFQVGTNSDVNFPDNSYYWAAWKVGSSYASTTTTSTTSVTTTSTLSTTSTSTFSTTSTSTLSTTLTTTTLLCAPEIIGTGPILRIRDRDTIVNLLKRKKQSGYRLCDWTPRIADYKRGGIWQDSPIAEGRRLAQRRFGNVAETMTLSMSGHNLETLIRESQDLRRLMEKASNYWWADWQNEPVWIEARASCETNARYAILHRGKILRDPNPYSQPFMERHYGRTAARNLSLILERGHWQSLPPECSVSVLASARECYEWPYHLEFNGVSSRVNCGNSAGLNELPDAAMTVEAWIRADGWGGNDQAMLVDKGHWYFRLESGFGLEAWISCVTAAGVSRCEIDDFIPDGEWHHVAMTWDDATYNYPRLWIDGVEPGYSSTINRNGAVLSDAAYFLYIGNRDAGGRAFDGGIGWVRVSDIVRYTATFTPLERCKLPIIDANTVGQWIGLEDSGATIDNQEGTAARDGAQTNCLFDVDCERCYGNVDLSQALQPVADHVYVGNKYNKANITHIFRYDAAPAGYSGNLVGTVPFDLLPAVPAVGDMVYFGIQNTPPDWGYFSSLVFDLENAQSNITGIVWKFWDGDSWEPITISKDNTESWFNVPFGKTGINSVVWELDDDFKTTMVNGITGAWVQAEVTSVGVAPTPPRQQNRDVYTVTWPYLEIDSAQIGGDIVALARYEMVSAGLEADDVIVGLRSLSRGADFSAYLNCGGHQNPDGITVVASGNCSIAAWAEAPARYAIQYAGGADGKFEIRLGPSVASQYYGVYHVYMRGYRAGAGTKEDTTFNVSFEQGSGKVVQQRLTGLYFTPYAKFELVDLGRLELSPPSLLDSGEEYNENKIVVDVSGVADVVFYDFILIPIDEWAGRFVDLEQGVNSTNRLSPGRLLEFESVRHPKQQLRASLWSRNSDRIVGHWDKRANGPVILQANADQRLWVLASLIDTDLDTIISRPEILTWFSVEAVQRYLSMRGDR